MNKKIKYTLYILSFFIFSSTMLFSQSKQTITGVVTDKKTKENLPFSSIRLKNHPIGTISDEAGEFKFLVPNEITDDTLVINYIGYEESEIELSSIESPLKIKLKSNSIEIEEAIILPMSAEDYIKRAVDRIGVNYPDKSFQTTSYYREEITENSSILHRSEGVFKSVYPEKVKGDTIENQHQLLLYREPDEIAKLQFMRHWLDKQDKKRIEEAEKEGEEIESESDAIMSQMNMGGPEILLSCDLKYELPSYLDTNQFKEYKYEIDGRSVYQGKELLRINYKSRGQVDNMRQHGEILLDLKSDAIVMIESSGKVVIPLAARPVLLALGFGIKDPVYNQTLKYESYGELWYPKDFHWSVSATLTKQHIARKKESSDLGIAQIFFVSEIATDDIIPIPEDKIFDPAKKMEEQVFNDNGIKWGEINVLGK